MIVNSIEKISQTFDEIIDHPHIRKYVHVYIVQQLNPHTLS